MENSDDSSLCGTGRREPADRERKLVYSPPTLQSWGTIVDLTRGPSSGGQDDGFLGTGGA